MTVGDRIKLVRESKGISQEQLAKQMGYSGKTSVSKIESSGDSLNIKTVSKYASALGVTESYLMGWEEDNPEVPDFDPEQIELIELYSKLTREQRNVVLKFLHTLVDG